MRNVKNENKPQGSKGKAAISPPPKGNQSLSGSLIQMCLLLTESVWCVCAVLLLVLFSLDICYGPSSLGLNSFYSRMDGFIVLYYSQVLQFI